MESIDKHSNIPSGIHIVEAKETVASTPPMMTLPHAEDTTSWSYLFLQHLTARNFEKWLESYNTHRGHQTYFVHHTYRYQYKNKETQRGVKKTVVPTISGLVFLQGSVRSIQQFLKCYFPQYHLVKDCSTGLPATIRDSAMQSFMRLSATHPQQITFLREPFENFVKDHVKLRVLTGVFKGYEGYIVRIDRDRQLVFDFGGLAVAIRGVHKEDFAIVE